MASMDDIYRAFLKADAAGDKQSARVLANYIREQTGYVEPEEERTFGGYAKEALKGLVPGAVGLGETAITGAAALLPDEAEEAIRRPVSEFAESVRERFAPAPGYEDTTVRKLSEAVGSTLPFLPLGALGAAGRIAATGLGVSAGAGEARQRAEEEEATEGERAAATALGAPVGALEALPPIRILRRLGFGDEAIEEVAGFAPALRRAAQAGGEEALQEASSQVLQNLIAKGVYAPDEEVFGGVGEAAATGGGAGAIVSAIADLALGRRLRGVESAPERREEEPAPPEAPSDSEIAPVQEARRLAMEQMELPLETEAVQMPLFEEEPAREPTPSLYRPAEEVMADLDLKPRSRAYKEEAKDLGLRLDRRGDLKPNQFVFQQPETEVPLTQGRFEFETQQVQPDLPMTVPPAEGQMDMFGAPMPRGGEMQIVPSRPEMPVVEEVPKEQYALNLPGIPMESLAPRDRVLRAMAITEDKKNIPNLQFATQLRPMELQKTIGDLKKEGAIAFNKQVNEWELTPVGAESVRSGPEVKPPSPRRRAALPVPPSRPAEPTVAESGERGVAGVSTAPARVDVGTQQVQPALGEPVFGSIDLGTSSENFEDQVVAPARKAVANGKGVTKTLKDGTQVSLIRLIDPDETGIERIIALDDNGEAVGDLTYTLVEGFQPTVFVTENAQRKGVATAMYDLAEATGAKIPPYSSTSAVRTVAGDAFRKAREQGKAPVSAAPPVDRMALIRRAAEQRVARSAINEVEGRRSSLRTQAIDAFENDQISEKTYTEITDQLKRPVPNFGMVEKVLSGEVKPGRRGIKFQRQVPRIQYKSEGPLYEQGLEFYYKGQKFEMGAGSGMFSRPILVVLDRNGNRVGAHYANNERRQVDARVGDASQIGQYNLPPDITNAINNYLFSYTKGDSAVVAAGKKVADTVNAEIAKYETQPTSETKPSRAQRGEVGAGLPAEQVQAAADDAVRTWANAPKVVVASSVDDPAIPEPLRKQIPKDAPGFYVDGTTYVLADRAKDEASVRGTVFHESLGHYGLEQEFQGGLRDVMQGIYDTNPKMREEANVRMKKFDLDAATAVEEVLAERSEAGPVKESWLRGAYSRVAAYIRNFLRQRGLVSTYSDNDVNQILKQAHRRVIEKKKAPYDPFDPAIRYQRSPEAQRKGDRAFINAIGKIPQNLPAATKETYELARNAASTVPSSLRSGLFSMLDPHEVGRMYGRQIKSNALENLWKTANQEGADLRKMQDTIMDNMTKWTKVMNKYSPAEQKKVNDLFMDTTTTKVKRQYVDAKGNTKEREEFGVEVLDIVDPARNINWKADVNHPLYKQLDALFKRDPAVKEVYKGLRLAYTDYSLAIEKILQQYLTPNEWQKILNKLNERRIRVYLPLFRQGNYKLKYVDKDGNPVSLQFETPRERDLAEKEILREGVMPNTRPIKSLVGERGGRELAPTGFFADVIATLQTKGVDQETQSLVFEHFLDYLPADSVLQRGRRREGTAGYSKNVLNAYANVADSFARRVSNMEFAPKYLELQRQFVADLSAARDRGDIDDSVADDLETYVQKYMDFTRNPNLNNWGAKLGYWSFQLYLGANISTAVTNVFDTPTVMLSRLLGKGHKIGSVGNALLKASGVYFSKQKSPEMQELLRRGLNTGILREQRLQDIAEFKNLDSRIEKIKAGVDRFTTYAFAKSDIFNRQIGLIAAYDLQKAKNKTPPGMFDQDAFDVAESVVADVYGSSFPKATAPIMGSDIAKTALTFKRFGIKRMHLLAAAYREAAKDLDPNDPDSKIIRDAARKEILGYFGTAFVVAGVQGMPLVGAGMGLATILNGILGDDDEPYNPDFQLREAVGLFNYKGPINYLIGIDIASRTGWTGMFWREDPKRMAEVGPVTYTMEQLLGPAYSYAVGVPKAYDYMKDGNYQRAFEQIMPRSVANISKGFRYGTEGALTAKGVPLVEDVNAYNVFMQVFGFRPSDVAEAGDIAGATKQMESKIFQRRNAIIARAAVARMSGDMDGFREALEEALQFSRKYPGKAITYDTLYEAVQRRTKKLALSVNGVTLDPKLAYQINEELGVTPEE